MTDEQWTYIDFLKNRPVEFAHMVGFTKLNNELHNGWIQNMTWGTEDETLQASRGTYKTTCDSISIALIMILLPKLRQIFLRKTDSDVKEVCRQVANILKNPKTRYIVSKIYPGTNLRLITESATEISTNLSMDVKGTNQLCCFGIGSSMTGKHADIIRTDDIVNIKDRVSRAEREQTKTTYQELQNVKNRGGRIVNTGTPWHKDDCFQLMPNIVKYDCYHVGDIITPAELEVLKSSMAPSLFAANYELRHVASEDVIFDEPVMGGEVSMVLNGIAHVDAAFYGEDWTAFGVMTKRDGKYYLFGKCWRKHVEDCYAEIVELYNRFLCGKIYLETNADKGMVARDLRKLGLKTMTYAESMNKYIKIVTYLKGIWKDVVIVDGTDPEYVNMICDYTENAEHDDAPDNAACLARLFYKKIDNSGYVSPIESGRVR
jgi:hypothetical protein